MQALYSVFISIIFILSSVVNVSYVHSMRPDAHNAAVIANGELMDKVGSLKESSPVVLAINNCEARFGTGMGVHAAALGEVDALFNVSGGGTNQIAKVTPVFGGIDLTKLEAGDWQNFADTSGVKYATLKGILDTAKSVNVNDAAVANLIRAQFGALPGKDSDANLVRKSLLIATLANKDAAAIKASIDD